MPPTSVEGGLRSRPGLSDRSRRPAPNLAGLPPTNWPDFLVPEAVFAMKNKDSGVFVGPVLAN